MRLRRKTSAAGVKCGGPAGRREHCLRIIETREKRERSDSDSEK